MISNKSSWPGTIVVLASLIVLLASGCGDKKQIRGKEFIPRDDMVELMLDIHLLDGITNDVKYYRKYNPNDSIDLYGLTFEDHGYHRAIFDSTLQEYSRFPHLLDELYDEIMMRLNMMQDQLDQEVEEKNEFKKKLPKPVR
jgi:hypothetical protein